MVFTLNPAAARKLASCGDGQIHTAIGASTTHNLPDDGEDFLLSLRSVNLQHLGGNFLFEGGKLHFEGFLFRVLCRFEFLIFFVNLRGFLFNGKYLLFQLLPSFLYNIQSFLHQRVIYQSRGL